MDCLIFISYASDNPEKPGHCVFDARSVRAKKNIDENKPIMVRLSKTQHFMGEIKLHPDKAGFGGTGLDQYGEFEISGRMIDHNLIITKEPVSEKNVGSTKSTTYNLRDFGSGFFGTFDSPDKDKAGWAHAVIVPKEKAIQTGLKL